MAISIETLSLAKKYVDKMINDNSEASENTTYSSKKIEELISAMPKVEHISVNGGYLQSEMSEHIVIETVKEE